MRGPKFVQVHCLFFQKYSSRTLVHSSGTFQQYFCTSRKLGAWGHVEQLVPSVAQRCQKGWRPNAEADFDDPMGCIGQRRWPATQPGRQRGRRCRCSPCGAAMGWWSWTSCTRGGRNWWLWVGSEERWNQGVGQEISKTQILETKL